jgi:hypothetical protein
MQAGDYGDDRLTPWQNRNRVIPKTTYCGRVIYERPKHYFTVKDAARVLHHISPDNEKTPQTFADELKQLLRDSTLWMMQQLLPFLNEDDVSSIYDVCISLLDSFFKIPVWNQRTLEVRARQLIIYLADRFGITITLSKPK